MASFGGHFPILEHENNYVNLLKPSYNIAAVLDRFVGVNHPRFGKTVSQEVRDKISAKLTGRKRTLVEIESHRKGSHKKPIYCYDATTKELLFVFESERGMYRQLNIPRSSFARKIDNNKVISFFYNNVENSCLLYTKPLGAVS